MRNSPRHSEHVDTCKATFIKTLYERINRESGTPQHERWSLVKIDGETQVLFEAHDGEGQNTADLIARQLMTVREALRLPQSIALRIWLALED